MTEVLDLPIQARGHGHVAVGHSRCNDHDRIVPVDAPRLHQLFKFTFFRKHVTDVPVIDRSAGADIVKIDQHGTGNVRAHAAAP